MHTLLHVFLLFLVSLRNMYLNIYRYFFNRVSRSDVTTSFVTVIPCPLTWQNGGNEVHSDIWKKTFIVSVRETPWPAMTNRSRYATAWGWPHLDSRTSPVNYADAVSLTLKSTAFQFGNHKYIRSMIWTVYCYFLKLSTDRKRSYNP